ncbi:MAG: TIGR03067 domain-containing protein [Actinomycetota bacterium]
MTRRAFWTAVLAFAVTAPVARAAEPAKEAVSLDGSWKVVALKSGDEEAPAEAFQWWRWEIKGKTIIISAEGEEPMELVAVIDAAKSPGAIDITALNGDTKGKTAKGIFELKQERLRVCLGGPGVEGPRPTEFDGGVGKGLITLERIKKP